jgi:hypothetical protein
MTIILQLILVSLVGSNFKFNNTVIVNYELIASNTQSFYKIVTLF